MYFNFWDFSIIYKKKKRSIIVDFSPAEIASLEDLIITTINYLCGYLIVRCSPSKLLPKKDLREMRKSTGEKKKTFFLNDTASIQNMINNVDLLSKTVSSEKS